MSAALWLAALGCVAAAVAYLALRGRAASGVLPIADAGSFAAARRRTWLLWAGLAGALVALLLVFVARAHAETAEQPILAPGSDAVVVIDLSGSTRTASKAIARVLLGLTRDPHRRLGLVVFSDTAYEALPPSTPAAALEGWLELLRGDTPRTYPWTPSFSSGTVISNGLVLARAMLRREGATDAHVVLVSDLVDAAPDLQKLETVIAQYQREHIDLKIVAVNQERGERSFGAVRELPNSTFVERAASLTVNPERSKPGGDDRKTVLLALVLVLGLVAAAHELAFHPLTWRTQT